MTKRGQKKYGSGARTRTITCPCGFVIKGDPTRIKLRYKLHQKKCEHIATQTEKNIIMEHISQDFNTVNGNENGKTKYTKNREMIVSSLKTSDGINMEKNRLDDLVIPVKELNHIKQRLKLEAISN